MTCKLLQLGDGHSLVQVFLHLGLGPYMTPREFVADLIAAGRSDADR